jgi:hypothetical protein
MQDPRAATLLLMVGLPGTGKTTHRARIAHRQASASHQTFPMTEADIDRWREQFQVPDAAELGGGKVPGPPAGWPGWPEWAADCWPSLADSYPSEAPRRIPASGQVNGPVGHAMDK